MATEKKGAFLPDWVLKLQPRDAEEYERLFLQKVRALAGVVDALETLEKQGDRETREKTAEAVRAETRKTCSQVDARIHNLYYKADKNEKYLKSRSTF